MINWLNFQSSLELVAFVSLFVALVVNWKNIIFFDSYPFSTLGKWSVYISNFSLFTLLESFISAPDLLIYLRASVPKLVLNIQKRGREYEESIRLDYLKRLNERYEAWISTYDRGNILVIDIDNNSFNENQEDLGKIISNIDAELHGLFIEK